MKELRSLELEMHVLAGVVRFQQSFCEIDGFLTKDCFTSETHGTIFSVARNLILQNQKFDRVFLGKRLKDININLNQEVDIFEYLDAIFHIPIKESALLPSAKELLELKIRRDIYEAAGEVQKHLISSREKPIQEVIQQCDTIYNGKINEFNTINSEVEDIFASMESRIEEIANNPIDQNKVILTEFPRINEQFGSLLRKGNITVIGARTGGNKTSLGMFTLINAAEKYGLPIVHVDQNEMNREELQFRACAMLSQGRIPYSFLENGDWRKVPDFVKIIRNEVWPRVKKIKFFYESVGNKSPSEICNSIKRISYNKIGRGNDFLLHFDYLKGGLNSDNKYNQEWLEMGRFVGDLKSLIQNELNIPLWTSLQLNRSGINNNKNSNEIDDSENSFSISDRIIHQVTHAFILRYKTNDELVMENNQFGNLKLIPLKKRHLGHDAEKVLTPVKVGKGKFQANYYNLEVKGFSFCEKGDLWDIVDKLKEQIDLSSKKDKDQNDGVLV